MEQFDLALSLSPICLGAQGTNPQLCYFCPHGPPDGQAPLDLRNAFHALSLINQRPALHDCCPC
jgi:hypothetical protein